MTRSIRVDSTSAHTAWEGEKTSQRGFGSSRRVETRSAAYRSTSLMRRCRARFTDLELIQPRYKRWTDAFLCTSPPPSTSVPAGMRKYTVRVCASVHLYVHLKDTVTNTYTSTSLFFNSVCDSERPPLMKLFHMPA